MVGLLSILVYGNVVGSNVFNLGVVLGICALLQTLNPAPEVWRRDGPFLVLGVAAVCVDCGDVFFVLETHWKQTP